MCCLARHVHQNGSSSYCSVVSLICSSNVYYALAGRKNTAKTDLGLAFMELTVQWKKHDYTKLSEQNINIWGQAQEKSGGTQENFGRKQGPIQIVGSGKDSSKK